MSNEHLLIKSRHNKEKGERGMDGEGERVGMFLLRVANRKERGVSRGGKNVNLNTHQLCLGGKQRIICRLKSNCNRVSVS